MGLLLRGGEGKGSDVTGGRGEKGSEGEGGSRMQGHRLAGAMGPALAKDGPG